VHKFIVDETFGLCHIDSKNEKQRIVTTIAEASQNVKEYLDDLFNTYLMNVEKGYDDLLEKLKKPTTTLAEFTLFVENLNYAVEKAKPLDQDK
jgi:hypothetical protein